MPTATASRSRPSLNGPLPALKSSDMKGPSTVSSRSFGSAARLVMDCQGTYSIMSTSPACSAATRAFSSAYAVMRSRFSLGSPGL